MKITKTQLKQIIKEEIGRVLTEEETGDPKEIAQLAAALDKSSAVQNTIAQLANDPKIAAALEGALESSLQEAFRGEPSEGEALEMNVGGAMGYAGGALTLTSVAALLAPANSVIAMELLPLLAASAPAAAIGIVGGVAIMALGALLIKKYSDKYGVGAQKKYKAQQRN